MKPKHRFSNSNEVYFGIEPDAKSFPNPLDPKFNSFLHDAFNWYNFSASSEKKKGWFVAWVKANHPKANVAAIEQINDGAFTTAGAVARLHSLGLSDSDYLNRKLEKWVGEFAEEGTIILRSKEAKVAAKKILASSDDQRLVFLMGSINTAIDEFINSGYSKTSFNMTKWIQLNNPSSVQLDAIQGRHFPLIEELINESNDKQLTEAYSHLTSKQVEKFVELLLDITTTKKIRKAVTTRKQKAKTPEKTTKNVKFAAIDLETGVKSVEPKSIPGSSSVLVWNKKYRMLGLYVAEEGKELSIKGSTIINYNQEFSTWKKVRKPNDVVPKAVTMSKAQIKKTIEALSSKPSKMNGRLNAETIVLKVF